jgi:cystathionine gamma-synthase
MAFRSHIETAVVHGGEGNAVTGDPVAIPLVPATSFFASPDGTGFSAADLDESSVPFYSRWGNPTVSLLEARLAQIEEGTDAVAFASGMSAISSLFISQLRTGDHLVLSDVCYAGVAELAQETLPRFGISVTTVDTSSAEEVKNAVRAGKTRLIHIETPANPILRLSDIATLSEIAHAAGAFLSVDSTIATPIATKPLLLGADFVIHSLTKYICGHGDALGGAIVVRDKNHIKSLRQEALIHYGGALNPFAAWLILRGLETLPIRMRVHEENARRLVDFLSQHPAVGRVYWPGYEADPQVELARKQMKNFSGLLSFTAKEGSAQLASQLAKRLRIFSYAVSIGKTRSLLFYIPTDDILRTSFRFSPSGEASYRAAAEEGVFRVSAGLEHSEDLIADLRQALASE